MCIRKSSCIYLLLDAHPCPQQFSKFSREIPMMCCYTQTHGTLNI